MIFSSDPSSRFENLKRHITKESFPRLKGIRTIASVLRPITPSIPLIFPPQLRDDPSLVPFSIEFEGFHIRYDVDRIYSPPYESFDRICNSDRAWSGSSSWELRRNNDDLAPTEICSDEDEDDGDEYVPSSSSEDEGEDDEDDASSLSGEDNAGDANDDENGTSSTNEDEDDQDNLSYISGDGTSSSVYSTDYEELMAQFSSMEIE